MEKYFTCASAKGKITFLKIFIIRIEAEGPYSIITEYPHYRTLVCMHLKAIEKSLKADTIFFRANKSHLINTFFIKKRIEERKSVFVWMDDYARILIARRKTKMFLRNIKKTKPIMKYCTMKNDRSLNAP